jgi:hypothetical protein
MKPKTGKGKQKTRSKKILEELEKNRAYKAKSRMKQKETELKQR